MEINIDHEGVVAGIADVGLVEDGHGLRRLAFQDARVSLAGRSMGMVVSSVRMEPFWG